MIKLKSLAKADSISGTPATCIKRLLAEMIKDAKELALNELCKKVLAPLLHVPLTDIPQPVVSGNSVEVRLSAKTDSDAARIVKAAMAKSPWLKLKAKTKDRNGSVYAFCLDSKAFANQIKSLKKFNPALAVQALEEASIKITFLKEQEKAKVETNIRPVLGPGSLSLSSFGLSEGKKYTKAALDKAVDAGIQKAGSAIPILNAVVDLARNNSRKVVMVAHPMATRDLAIVEKTFLPIAAAIAALHANPKLTAMFMGSNFVLYSGKRPVGRLGDSLLGKIKLRDAVKRCEKECGKYGNPSKILDVLDAEGQQKEKRLSELFNDLAKHIQTHSSGPAARAALKLKKAAGIEGPLDWNAFYKVVQDAAKEIRAHRSHPFISNIKDVVSELNKGRGVLDLWRIKWEADIALDRLDWLGIIIADVLEDEVMKNSRAVQSLSCTVDWLQNTVPCALSLKYQGSSGIRVAFEPCKAFAPRNWKIELQGIMESSPGWSLL